jgi:hypothetical protein
MNYRRALERLLGKKMLIALDLQMVKSRSG